jgi:adenosylhomocysteinase
MGALVVVTEVDPLKALEALMDGFQVLPLLEACQRGDIFVTVTGDKNVIDAQHMAVMKNGAVMANSGHFNSEINIAALEKMSTGEPRLIRPFVAQYTTSDGRHLNLLGDGRLINLAAAEGHPAAVMDMSFANQALGLEFMRANAKTLENDVYTIPEAIDREIARLKLVSMGVKIDTLTDEQEKYLSSWQEGT